MCQNICRGIFVLRHIFLALMLTEKLVDKHHFKMGRSMQCQWQEDRSANDGVLWLTGTKEGYIIQNIFSFYFFGSG